MNDLTRGLATRTGVFVFIFVLVLISSGAQAVHAQTPNFSGMWTLDQNASDFTPPAFSGGRGGAGIRRLFITHAANGTVVIGAETNGLKAWSYTPGRELSIPVGRDTTMMAASRWEGEHLVAEGRQGDMQMHEVMALSPDGSTLTISVTTTTPAGKTVNRLVYTKTQAVGPCETWAMPCKEFPEHVGPR